MKKYTYLTAALIAAACLVSCSETEENITRTSASPLDHFLLAEAPSGASQISDAFTDPTPGRAVVISGEVMGSAEPFVNGRAMVVLGDPTRLTPCNRMPGDSCPTPWDVCCDDPAVIKKSIVTVQFLDSEGKVIKSGLKGYKGVGELSYLTVTGKIAEGSNPQNLLINASGFYVAAESPYKNAKPVSHSEF